MAVRNLEAVQQLSGLAVRAESRPGRIGPISLGAKQTGERRAGNPHAAFDVAGIGNVAWSRCCDTRRRKGETTGNTNIDLNRRASPRPYLGAPGGAIPPGDSTYPDRLIGRRMSASAGCRRGPRGQSVGLAARFCLKTRCPRRGALRASDLPASFRATRAVVAPSALARGRGRSASFNGRARGEGVNLKQDFKRTEGVIRWPSSDGRTARRRQHHRHHG